MITGGAALEHAGLTDQHYFGLTVLVARQMNPLVFRGQTASFFATDTENIWGADPATRPAFALPERAIVEGQCQAEFARAPGFDNRRAGGDDKIGVRAVFADIGIPDIGEGRSRTYQAGTGDCDRQNHAIQMRAHLFSQTIPD